MRLYRVVNFLCLGVVFLHSASHAHSPGSEMATAAQNLLNALSPEQRAKAVFDLKDDERMNWHFVPKARPGLPLRDMTPAQNALAHALLASGLSQRGYAKATTIISLEQILFDLENKAPRRDAGLYYFTFFGKPDTGPWGWRVEGHHLSLNFTVDGDNIQSVTPSFFGTNPARILDGPRKGLRTLAFEEDLARALVKSLDSSQQTLAIITNTAPRDIITGNSRKVTALQPAGIPVAKLSGPQKDAFYSLLREYLLRYRGEIAEPELKKIQDQGDDKLYFAWAGSLESGEGHYYRIQGASFLVEYDNTQDHANHIHTVWRDLQHDFGGDTLRQHYDQSSHSK